MALFVCVHNWGRSQMAEAFFNELTGGKAIAVSAGTRLAAHMDHNVVAAMRKTGIDIRNQAPKLLTVEMMEQADRVITMGGNVGETYPAGFFPTEDWKLDDPAGKSMDEVRKIRDSIKAKVAAPAKELHHNDNRKLRGIFPKSSENQYITNQSYLY